MRACDANRCQMLWTKSPCVGSDDADFALRAVDPPCKGHLQETGREYRYACGPGQFPLEDGIESTARGYGLDTLRYHLPGIGNHRTKHRLIWVFKNRMDIRTAHRVEPDRVSIRRGIGAVANQGLKLLQAPGHLPFFPAQDSDLCRFGFNYHKLLQQARLFFIVLQLRIWRFDRVKGQMDLDGH